MTHANNDDYKGTPNFTRVPVLIFYVLYRHVELYREEGRTEFMIYEADRTIVSRTTTVS